MGSMKEEWPPVKSLKSDWPPFKEKKSPEYGD
jgi:hypothetical protein